MHTISRLVLFFLLLTASNTIVCMECMQSTQKPEYQLLDSPEKALIDAIKQGNLASTATLIAQGAPVNYNNGKPLQLALRLWIQHYNSSRLYSATSLEKQNARTNTRLYQRITKMLLTENADPNIEWRGHNPLLLLCNAPINHYNAVKLLLKYKANPDKELSLTKASSSLKSSLALHCALMHNHLDLVDLLIHNNARLDLIDTHGYSLLDCARTDNATAYILEHITKMPSIPACEKFRSNYHLADAIEMGDLRRIKKLVTHSHADINYKKEATMAANFVSSSAVSPFHLLCKRYFYFILCDAFDQNNSNNSSKKAIALSRNVQRSLDDCYTIAHYLLKHRADPNINYNTTTPLINAIEKQNIELVQLLIKHNADIHKKNRYGKSAVDIVFDETYSNKDIQRLVLSSNHVRFSNEKTADDAH